MLLRSLLCVSVFFALWTARCQTTASVTPRQHFVCNAGYTIERCRAQMPALKRVLDQYGAERLGDWTWVLVRSQDWKRIKTNMGLNPGSPAFTTLALRETFIEEALVAPVPGRSAELMQSWSSSIDDLLLLAVSHELGHALCHEAGESQADAYGKLLRAGEHVRCH